MTTPTAASSRFTRVERRRVALVLAALAGLHLLGWGLYLAHQSAFAAAGGLAAVGGIAYLLGVRHGFDADHVAVIDDATRLMLQRGRRPISTGLWFALGHASVAAGLLADAGLGALGPLAAVGEHFQTVGWVALLVLLAAWAGGALWRRAGKAGNAMEQRAV